MAVLGAGRPASQDWALLLAQYDAEYVPHRRTVRQFAQDRNLRYKIVVQAFARERKRNALIAVHDRNKPLALAAQRRIMEAIGNLENFKDPLRAAEFALKVFNGIMEREEPNPGLVAQVNIKIPPLFGESALAKKAMEVLQAEGEPQAVVARVVPEAS